MNIAVIGKNFGDEGKGLVTDYLAASMERPLVIRHNGGAQSGHTVETPSYRFVFHELSSGSFRHADTLWTDTFYPDLYKLEEEIEEFRQIAGFIPNIYAEPDTAITTIDDVLLNMAIERSRGEYRHGSCGMGINECDIRCRAGFRLTISKIKSKTEQDLIQTLRYQRQEYTKQRLKAIESILTSEAESYIDLLKDDNILVNSAKEIYKNAKQVIIQEPKDIQTYSDLIFEGGQGLLLDKDNEEYAPNVTASSTGLTNPIAFLTKINQPLDEAIYVSRTYVTRHGPGKLNHECTRQTLNLIQTDQTNLPNEWQGTLRYATHGTAQDFTDPVRRDLKQLPKNQPTPTVSLFLTHINETDNKVLLSAGKIDVNEFVTLGEIKKLFDKMYLSDRRYADA